MNDVEQLHHDIDLCIRLLQSLKINALVEQYSWQPYELYYIINSSAVNRTRIMVNDILKGKLVSADGGN